MLCHLSQMTNLTPIVKQHLLSKKLILVDQDHKKHSLSKVFEKKDNKLELLLLNVTNLYDQCDATVVEEEVIDIDITPPPIKDLEVFTSKNIHVTNNKHYAFKNNIKTPYLSEQVFDLLLKHVAEQQHIHPFVFLHYHLLYLIPNYEQFTLLFLQQHMQNVKQVMLYIEQLIVNQINNQYKQTKNGYKSNVNFTNLQYIPLTFEFMMTKMLDVLNRLSFDDAVRVITGNVINKQIVKPLNVDNLYHSIINSKYDKSKVLYQDLLTDVNKYNNQPQLNLKFLKWLALLHNDATSVSDFIHNIDINIFDTYKQFISGKIQFSTLVDFLSINDIAQYIVDIANAYNLNIDLLLNYTTITALEPYDNFKLATIKKEITTMDDFTKILDKLKSKIMLVKLIDTIANHYELDKNNKDVNAFLIDVSEKMIKHNLTLPDSMIQHMINNQAFSWSSFITATIDVNEVIQNIVLINTNEVMLQYIYHYLNKTINEDIKSDILDLLKNRNLLQLFILYLKKEFDKDTLSNVVLVQLNTKKNKIASSEVSASPKKSKSKKSKKYEPSSEEETEEMTEEDEEYEEPKKSKKSKRS